MGCFCDHTVNKARPRFVLLREENESQHVRHSWREPRWQCPCSISIYSYTTRRKCMRVRVQQEQKFLVTTERALWRYDNAFIFTNQSDVDFGITLVVGCLYHYFLKSGNFSFINVTFYCRPNNARTSGSLKPKFIGIYLRTAGDCIGLQKCVCVTNQKEISRIVAWNLCIIVRRVTKKTRGVCW